MQSLYNFLTEGLFGGSKRGMKQIEYCEKFIHELETGDVVFCAQVNRRTHHIICAFGPMENVKTNCKVKVHNKDYQTNMSSYEVNGLEGYFEPTGFNRGEKYDIVKSDTKIYLTISQAETKEYIYKQLHLLTKNETNVTKQTVRKFRDTSNQTFDPNDLELHDDDKIDEEPAKKAVSLSASDLDVSASASSSTPSRASRSFSASDLELHDDAPVTKSSGPAKRSGGFSASDLELQDYGEEDETKLPLCGKLIKDLKAGDVIFGAFKSARGKLVTIKGKITTINWSIGRLNIGTVTIKFPKYIISGETCREWDRVSKTEYYIATNDKDAAEIIRNYQ